MIQGDDCQNDWSKYKFVYLNDYEFGYLDRIILNADFTIIAGHQRFEILKNQGLDEIECLVPEKELSENEVDRLMIGHNFFTGEFDVAFLEKEYDRSFLEELGVGELLSKVVNQEDGSEYNDANCVYPLVPQYDEKYNAFVIICTSETEEAAIRTKFNFPMKAQSYKNSYLGKSYVLKAKDILDGKNLS